MSRIPTLTHRVEYAGFRLFSFVLGVLPEAWALWLGGVVGTVAGSVLRVRRKVVDENLARAFPASTPKWRASIARRCYRHLGRESVTTLRLSRLDQAGVRARTRVEPMELLDEAMAQGRGAVLLTGHLGNWELCGASLACRGVPLHAVVVEQANPLFDRDLDRTRRRLGYRPLPRGGTVAPVLRALRDGAAVAFVGDQNVRRGGVFVDFFGVPAATARGPAVLALRTGAPVIYGALLRMPDDTYSMTLRPLDFEPTGDTEADVQAFTEAYTRALERLIEGAPEQYFWFHKRWKTRPPAPEGHGTQEPGS